MKAFFSAFGLLCLLAACNTKPSTPGADASKTILEPRVLKSFFLLNTVTVTERQCWLINGPQDFERLFGMAKTMKNEIVRPNFDSSLVGAIAVPPTNRLTDFRIAKIEQSGDTAKVHFEIVQGKDEMTWTSQPLVVFTFPKSPEIKTVTFVQTGIPISSFPVIKEMAAQENSSSFVEVPNYFIRVVDKMGSSPACHLIGSKEAYMSTLYVPKGVELPEPNYEQEILAVLVFPDTQKATEIKLASASVQGEDLQLTVSVHEGSDQSYSMRPNIVVKGPRAGLKTVTFTDGKQKLCSAQLK